MNFFDDFLALLNLSPNLSPKFFTFPLFSSFFKFSARMCKEEDEGSTVAAKSERGISSSESTGVDLLDGLMLDEVEEGR